MRGLIEDFDWRTKVYFWLRFGVLILYGVKEV